MKWEPAAGNNETGTKTSLTKALGEGRQDTSFPETRLLRTESFQAAENPARNIRGGFRLRAGTRRNR